jgi:hypothetical protein
VACQLEWHVSMSADRSEKVYDRGVNIMAVHRTAFVTQQHSGRVSDTSRGAVNTIQWPQCR